MRCQQNKYPTEQENQQHGLDTEEIWKKLSKRIGILPPYFALTALSHSPPYFFATATAEMPAFYEQGPMTAAEIGRHAAITGLSHAALFQNDDKKRYYLARHAKCQYFPNSAPYGTPVQLVSRITKLDKRELETEVKAYTENQLLACLQLNYSILNEAIFKRLFKEKKQIEIKKGPNPYTSLLKREYQRGEDWIEQTVDRVLPSSCAGHFSEYPALPVAIVMGQLSYLAGQIIGKGLKKFRVIHGDVKATNLAWAGERVTFKVTRTHQKTSYQWFTCKAYSNDHQIGEMLLKTETLESPLSNSCIDA